MAVLLGQRVPIGKITKFDRPAGWAYGCVQRAIALDDRSPTTDAARQAMIQSLRRFGQRSPVVVWPTSGAQVLIEGFKRLVAARHLPELAALAARPIEADARTPME